MIIVPKITFSFRFLINYFLLFKNCPDISNSLIILSLINISLCSCYFFSTFSSFVTKRVLISLNILDLIFSLFSSDVKGFLIFCFCSLLSFFPLPCTVFLGVFVLKILAILCLKLPTLFLIG